MTTGNSIRLGFVGDLMLARELNFVLDEHPSEWVWGDMLPEMTACDAVIGNLECPITEHPRRWRLGLTKAFHFRARPRAVDCLRAGNVRAVNLANNHMLDHGVPGLMDTLRFLGAGGIAHCGAGADIEAASQPAVFAAGGVRVGMLGLTDNVPEFGAKANRPGTYMRRIGPDRPLVAELTARIDRMRADGVGLVILSLHWGPNFRVHPPERFRAFARTMIERGVDIVHGHSAHITQAVEVYRDRLILYDTGDFISDYWRFPGHRNLWSFFFRVAVEGGRPAGLEMTPVELHAGSVRQAHGEVADGIIERMLRLCRRTGTDLVRDHRRLRLAF